MVDKPDIYHKNPLVGYSILVISFVLRWLLFRVFGGVLSFIDSKYNGEKMFTKRSEKKYSSSIKKLLFILSFVIVETFITSCSSNQINTTAMVRTVDVSYSQDVAPIFANRCEKCHGARVQKGQLDLSSYSAIMAGGGKGEVISPGNADDSTLIQMVTSGKMPRQGAKLTPDQISLLRDWVNAGALDN